MNHITSSWAQQYCLFDPGILANDINSIGLSLISATTRVMECTSQATSDAGPALDDAVRQLVLGWSARRAHDNLETIRRANEQVRDACTTMAHHTRRLHEAILAARSSVVSAYAAADASIASGNLLHYPVSYGEDPVTSLMRAYIDPMDKARIDGARCGVVSDVYFALTTAQRALDDVAEFVAASLRVDPWTALPAPLMPTAQTEASRANLRNQLILNADLASADEWRRRFALSVTAALNRGSESGADVQLLAYDSDEPALQGGVVLAIGDVASAKFVTTIVPGVGNSPLDMGDTVDLASTLNDKVTSTARNGGSSATVLWFDYDIPMSVGYDKIPDSTTQAVLHGFSDVLNGANSTHADAESERLVEFLGELRSLVAPGAQISLVGHSYGAVVASLAAKRLPAKVSLKSLFMLAAPGAGRGVHSAKSYPALSPEQVYVASYPFDPVTSSAFDELLDANPTHAWARRYLPFSVDDGPFGADPARAAFGAQVINTPSNVPTDGRNPADFSQHALTNYLAGETLGAIAAVMTGQPQGIPLRPRK